MVQRPDTLEPAQPWLHAHATNDESMQVPTSVRLRRLVALLVRSGAEQFQQSCGLSTFEWRVLALVCEMPQLSINDLSGRLHREVAQVSRTVKKMVTAKLLRRDNRGGGPGVLVTSTALGGIVYRRLRQLTSRRNAELVSGLSPDQLAVLDHCIAVMTANARAQMRATAARVNGTNTRERRTAPRTAVA